MGLDGFKLVESEILAVTDTTGGTTYYVMDNNKWKHYCLRPITERGKEFQFCSRPAGWGTGHVGMGACKNHAGNQPFPIATIREGRYSGVLKRDLGLAYREYAQDPDLLNLTDELALQRALLVEAVKRYDRVKGSNALQQVLSTVKDITTTVERIERIQANQTLTVASSRMMMMIAIQVAGQFLDGEILQDFIRTWKEAVLERYTQNPLEPPKQIT